MPENQTKREAKFSDYLSIVLKWKKFLIINLLIVLIISLVVAFLIPQTYKATTTLMLPKNQDIMGASSLTGLLSSASPFLGSKLFGGSGQSMDEIFGILNSRRMLVNVIDKFHLMNYYKINNNNIDKAVKAFRGDFNADLDENSMIVISVINESPDTSAMIANYMVGLLDSLNTSFNVQEAKDYRKFVELRYLKNIQDLNAAQDSLKEFQKKYGVYAIPEQIEAAIKIVGELETSLTEKEIESYGLKQQLGETSPVYRNLSFQIDSLKSRLSELKNASKLPFNSIVLFPFKNVPEMQEKYFEFYREVEIQTKIMEFILPVYEKAKIDEQKSIPTVVVLDRAYPPEIKYQPKRTFIILGISFPLFIIFLLMIFRGEKSIYGEENKNLVEEKEYRFYKKICRIYRLKF